MPAILSVALIAGAGSCFMLANLAMKILGQTPFYVLYPVIFVTFAAGAYFEVQALKHAQLGYAVTFILGCELLLSIMIAVVFLKESYSTVNLLGMALVIVGISLLHLPTGTMETGSKSAMAARDRLNL
jgi:multidrug transporter EmrE-like cation transporter